MLGFLTQFLIAILSWVEERANRGHIAIDADRDDGRIRRAGSRLREWMRTDGSSKSGQSDAGRPECTGTDVRKN